MTFAHATTAKITTPSGRISDATNSKSAEATLWRRVRSSQRCAITPAVTKKVNEVVSKPEKVQTEKPVLSESASKPPPVTIHHPLEPTGLS